MNNLKLILTTVVFLALVLPINAEIGQKYHLENFSIEPVQLISLFENEAIELEIREGMHIIVVDEIKEGHEVNLDIFPYQKNVAYVQIKSGISTKIDFDRDKNKDIQIEVVNSDYTTKIVTLRFTKLEGADKEIIGPEFNDTTTINESTPGIVTGLIIAGIIILVGLLVYFIFKKK